MTAGPFAADEVIKKAFPETRDKLNNNISPQLRRKIEVIIIIFGIFCAGFFAFNKEHLARLNAESGQESALQKIAESTPSELEKQVKALKNSNVSLQQDVESERMARLKIEEKLAPRSLTEAQIQNISHKLSQFSPQSFEFLSYQDDAEVRNLLLLIAKALIGAGWKGQAPSGFLAFNLEFGVTVELTTENQNKFRPAADALANALNEEGILAAVNVNSEITDKIDLIRIRIGKKP